MANRQYVGARYVPKYYEGSNGNEWDSGVPYEPLTIVTYLTNTYTSKIPVPVSSTPPNLDTEHWVLTSAYSSQVAELREKIEEIDTNIEDNIEPDIVNLNNTKDYFSGDIVVIGDSYLQGYNPDGNTTSWGVNIKDALNLGTKYHSYSEGGIGFVHIGQHNNRFEDLLDQAVADTDFDNDNVSLVIIGGGYNDAVLPATEADVNYHISNCADIIRTNFPNAKGVVCWVANAQYPSTCTYVQMYTGINRWGNACASYGLSFIGKSGSVLKGGPSSGLGTDGVHPTNYGQKQIALSILNGIGCGDYIGVSPNFTYSEGNSIYVLASNDIVTVDFFQAKAYTITATTIACNGSNTILDIDLTSLNIRPLLSDNLISFIGKIMMTDGDGKYYITDANFKFLKNGHLTIAPFAINSTNTNFMTITNCGWVQILPQVISIPRILV